MGADVVTVHVPLLCLFLRAVLVCLASDGSLVSLGMFAVNLDVSWAKKWYRKGIFFFTCILEDRGRRGRSLRMGSPLPSRLMRSLPARLHPGSARLRFESNQR